MTVQRKLNLASRKLFYFPVVKNRCVFVNGRNSWWQKLLRFSFSKTKPRLFQSFGMLWNRLRLDLFFSIYSKGVLFLEMCLFNAYQCIASDLILDFFIHTFRVSLTSHLASSSQLPLCVSQYAPIECPSAGVLCWNLWCCR